MKKIKYELEKGECNTWWIKINGKDIAFIEKRKSFQISFYCIRNSKWKIVEGYCVPVIYLEVCNEDLNKSIEIFLRMLVRETEDVNEFV